MTASDEARIHVRKLLIETLIKNPPPDVDPEQWTAEFIAEKTNAIPDATFHAYPVFTHDR